MCPNVRIGIELRTVGSFAEPDGSVSAATLRCLADFTGVAVIGDKSAWKTMMDRVTQALPPLEDASADETTGVVGTVGGAASAIDSIKPDYTGEVAVLNGTGVVRVDAVDS